MFESVSPVTNGNTMPRYEIICYGTVRSLCLYILFKHDFEIYNLEMGLHVILLETVMILQEQ